MLNISACLQNFNLSGCLQNSTWLKYLWRAWGIWCHRCGGSKGWSAPWTLLLLLEGPAKQRVKVRENHYRIDEENQEKEGPAQTDEQF